VIGADGLLDDEMLRRHDGQILTIDPQIGRSHRAEDLHRIDDPVHIETGAIIRLGRDGIRFRQKAEVSQPVQEPGIGASGNPESGIAVATTTEGLVQGETGITTPRPFTGDVDVRQARGQCLIHLTIQLLAPEPLRPQGVVVLQGVLHASLQPEDHVAPVTSHHHLTQRRLGRELGRCRVLPHGGTDQPETAQHHHQTHKAGRSMWPILDTFRTLHAFVPLCYKPICPPCTVLLTTLESKLRYSILDSSLS